MKKYIEHIKTKTPHDRRRHALAVAGTVTGLLLVAWVGTLGVRLGAVGQVAQDKSDASQAAAAAQAQYAGGPQLQVSTTSMFSN